MAASEKKKKKETHNLDGGGAQNREGRGYRRNLGGRSLKKGIIREKRNFKKEVLLRKGANC